MRKFCNKGVSRVLVQLLTWLGIGSASMLFVACYGAPPEGYQTIDEVDTVTVMVGDSVVMSVSKSDK